MSSDLILKKRATNVTFALYNSTHVLSLTGEKTHLKNYPHLNMYMYQCMKTAFCICIVYTHHRGHKKLEEFFISRCNLSQCSNHS